MTESISPRHLRTKPLHREIELDFIRGIAILMVVDFHTSGSPFRPLCIWLGYQNHIGVLGVDIFFVLSGFLVGGLLMKEWKVRRGIDGEMAYIELPLPKRNSPPRQRGARLGHISAAARNSKSSWTSTAL